MDHLTNRNPIMACLLAASLSLLGCAAVPPAPDRATAKAIDQSMQRDLDANAGQTSKPEPDRAWVPQELVRSMSQSMAADVMLPASARGSVEPRFDLAVRDVPMGQVLGGLVEGTDFSLVIKTVSGNAATPIEEPKVTINLRNVTMLEALDAIRDAYAYDYQINGQRILVEPARLQTRMYQVNYVAGKRRGVSDIQVIGGAAANGASGDSGFSALQASGLNTSVQSDFWGEVEDALRTAVGCTISKSMGSLATTAQTVRPTTSTGGGVGSATSESTSGERGVTGCPEGRAIAVNAMTGAILARGMPAELRLVERILQSMQLSVSRQVIIEAKVVDVELNNNAQQGINWALFKNGQHRLSLGASGSVIGSNQAGQSGGAVDTGSSLNSLLGLNRLPSSTVSGAAGLALQATNFGALINFLETQGQVHVLSSPRIATLNNQKAVIKVGSEEAFVTSIEGGTTTVTNGTSTVVTPPSLTYRPFFSGIDLDVTPQIDANNRITLHVHTMVNRVVEREKIALPGTTTTVPFAMNSMNQTDSVVQAANGQVIVIGGLMSERTEDSRSGVPGARDLPAAGGLFRWGEQARVKRELVILLKCTVVDDGRVWGEQIDTARQRVNRLTREQ